MKTIYSVSFIAIISAAVFSCSKSSVPPTTITKVDTSKTLISDIRLVGYWDIVTDTISYNGNTIMYKGSPGDYYKFTKYGNLYIAESLENLVDTAIYQISSTTNQVGWTNIYTRINGVATTQTSTTSPFVITSVDTAKMVLTQNAQTTAGPRYEQVTFKKHK